MTSWKNRRCPTGKKRFRTKQDADDMVLTAKISRALRRQSKRHEQRSYKCDRCDAWHVTKHPQPPKELRGAGHGNVRKSSKARS